MVVGAGVYRGMEEEEEEVEEEDYVSPPPGNEPRGPFFSSESKSVTLTFTIYSCVWQRSF